MDWEKIRADWAARGFSCGLWVDPPGKVWADFVDDTDELVMVMERQQEFEMTRKSYRPRIDEELLIPAGTRHTARTLAKLHQSGSTDTSGDKISRILTEISRGQSSHAGQCCLLHHY